MGKYWCALLSGHITHRWGHVHPGMSGTGLEDVIKDVTSTTETSQVFFFAFSIINCSNSPLFRALITRKHNAERPSRPL